MTLLALNKPELRSLYIWSQMRHTDERIHDLSRQAALPPARKYSWLSSNLKTARNITRGFHNSDLFHLCTLPVTNYFTLQITSPTNTFVSVTSREKTRVKFISVYIRALL